MNRQERYLDILLEKIKLAYKKFYTFDNMILVIVGDLKTKDVFNTIENCIQLLKKTSFLFNFEKSKSLFRTVKQVEKYRTLAYNDVPLLGGDYEIFLSDIPFDYFLIRLRTKYFK